MTAPIYDRDACGCVVVFSRGTGFGDTGAPDESRGHHFFSIQLRPLSGLAQLGQVFLAGQTIDGDDGWTTA